MKIIGISAHAARSGKDTLAKCLQLILSEKGEKVAIRSLASPLKERLHGFILNEFQIDIHNCSDEEKSLVRPIMVAYGGIKRNQTKGKFWTGLMDIEIRRLKKEGYTVCVIPDIRYCEHEKDEGDWLKSKDATLFFVSLIEDGSRLEPPNEDERRNGPLLEAISDFKVEWPHMSFEECLLLVRKNWNTYKSLL